MRIARTWPHSRLRCMGFDFAGDGTRTWIATVSRVDVVVHPVFGCATTHAQSASYDPAGPIAVPFASPRLEHAMRAPKPPDAVVVADADAGALLGEGARRGTPLVVALRAFERLRASAPSSMLGFCWRRGDTGGEPGLGPAEHEAVFVANLTLVMLEAASPDELVWLGREA